MATFSEAMNGATATKASVGLVKAGTTTVIPAAVSYDPAAKRATLNPSANLARGTKYTATVTVGAKDLAGNALDQNSTQSGAQPMSWCFTTAR